jgi:hypothetical protein
MCGSCHRLNSCFHAAGALVATQAEVAICLD